MATSFEEDGRWDACWQLELNRDNVIAWKDTSTREFVGWAGVVYEPPFSLPLFPDPLSSLCAVRVMMMVRHLFFKASLLLSDDVDQDGLSIEGHSCSEVDFAGKDLARFVVGLV